jgi:hypothetical protein
MEPFVSFSTVKAFFIDGRLKIKRSDGYLLG